MCVFTAVIVVQLFRRNNKINCADCLEVLTVLACLTSSLTVLFPAWETSN